MDVSDYPGEYPDSNVYQVAEKRFQDHYLGPLGNDVKYVRLENMHKKDSRCDDLVEKTAAALNEDTVALMLLTVQRGNIELSVKTSLSRVRRLTGFEVKQVIRACLVPFPYLWASVYISSHGRFMSNNVPCHPTLSLSLNFLILNWNWGIGRRIFGIRRIFRKIIFEFHLILNGSSHHHLIIVIILIFKHAMFLRASNSAQLALSQAEKNYQGGNIHSKIQEYLKAFSPEDSVEQFAGFIIATAMEPSQSSIDIGE
ncbi:hypothetical protein EI94DRAFT_1756619 [Lactarius quietus]|nr:hypothetical protein EI94DRAFT_1756619 [Lactarius quietus]